MIRYFRTYLNIGSGILSIVIYVMLVIELIFFLTLSPYQVFVQIHQYIFILLCIDTLLRWIIRPKKSFGYMRLAIGCLAVLPLINHYMVPFFPANINFGIQQSLLIIIAGTRIQHLSFLFEPLRSNPAQTFIGGFILAIILGALFLTVPLAHTQPIAFIDAFFIAVSAICVTGLTVFDVGTTLTPLGQVILMVLIQIGGLGIMTFYALVSISLHHRFLSTETQELQAGWSTESLKETFGLVKSIFYVTFFLELVGAMLLFPFIPETVGDIPQRMFYALFHAVSAFCNAGFSLFPNSLAVFSSSVGVMAIFCVLIIVGGLGFPVIFELYHRYVTHRKQRLKLQTKLVLYVTAALIMIGTLVLFLQSMITGQGDSSMMQALFHAVSARTAGFSMGDMQQHTMASLWFVLFLMFIGASPGSTGGGIKTTTLGVLIVALVSTIRGKDRIHIFGRHLPPKLMFKAITIITMALFILFVAFFVLLNTESIPFFPLLFETFSAFATVGYSLGVTGDLSSVGKVIMMCLMFFGRVGPLTLAFALTRRTKTANYKLPDEHVLLG
jgi:trk system potassium uptake protein